jgi:HK97 family phage portal protein
VSRFRRYASEVARAFVTGPGAVPDQSGGGYLAAFGQEDERRIDYGEYIQTSNAVYTAARIRASLMSSVPIVAYRVAGDGRKDKVTSGPLVELLAKVNPFWTFQRLIEMTELSLCLWGSAYVFLDRGTNRRQAPRELWWARPDRVTVVPDKEKYVSHFLYQVGDEEQPIRFERDEVIWFRYPNPMNEFEGLSPLASAAIAADTSRAAMISNAAMFRNGLQLAGVVQPANGQMLTEEQARGLEQSMARRFKGVDKAHRWGVMRFEAKFQSLSVTPKDAEFLGSLKWSLEEICRAYGVPLDLVGGERTYANQHDARLAIWTDTIQPEARFIATELTEQLLPLFPGVADLIEFDLSGVAVLQEAEAAKWEIERQKLDAGIMLPNEWRASKGLDPVPWGDAWWAQTAGGGLGPVTSVLPPIAPNQQISFGGLTVNELRASQGLSPVPWGDVWWAPAGSQAVSGGGGSSTASTGSLPGTVEEGGATRAIADVNLRPPESVAAVARRALAWREEGRPGGTAVGLARANQLANRENLSPETIGRMVSYFARHEVDKDATGFSSGEEGFPSPGRVAWDLWGGDPGRTWAEDRYEAIQAERSLPSAAQQVARQPVRAVDGIDLKPSVEVAEVAARALVWADEGRPGGTWLGVVRANQLESRQPVTPDIIVRMLAYFDDNEDARSGEGFDEDSNGFPSPGRVGWDLWGGDAGRAWATAKQQELLDAGLGSARGRAPHAIAYGSPEHIERWSSHVRRVTKEEEQFIGVVQSVMRRQRQSVIAKLKQNQERMRTIQEAADDPFDLARWIREYRVAVRPVYSDVIGRVGQDAIDGVGIGRSFDVLDPRVVQAVEGRAQFFATKVNETTYKLLQDELRQAIVDGEDVRKTTARVESVMAGRIASTAETIARTEVGAIVTAGQSEGWRQSGVVEGKQWLAALDNRTRRTHIEAHNSVVALDENFTVGAATGPGPCQMSSASESANCRCSLIPVLGEVVVVPEQTSATDDPTASGNDAWRPSMSREEAEAWAKSEGGKMGDETFYHFTSDTAVPSILETGLRSGDGAFGRFVYATNAQQVEGTYAKAGSAMLEVRFKAKNPLRASTKDFIAMQGDSDLEPHEWLVQNGYDAWVRPLPDGSYWAMAPRTEQVVVITP